MYEAVVLALRAFSRASGMRASLVCRKRDVDLMERRSHWARNLPRKLSSAMDRPFSASVW